jgi:hypothetical protein
LMALEPAIQTQSLLAGSKVHRSLRLPFVASAAPLPLPPHR